jgi:hypothetical protein
MKKPDSDVGLFLWGLGVFVALWLAQGFIQLVLEAGSD